MLPCVRGHTFLVGDALATLVLVLGHLLCSQFLDLFFACKEGLEY